MSLRAARLPAAALALFPVLLTAGYAAEQGGLSELAPPARATPAPAMTQMELGTRLLAAREPELAMRAFVTSLSTEGVSAEAMTGAGIAARQQGLVHESRRYLDRAVLLAPDSATAQYNLGVVLYELNEYHAARNAFRSAFALSSGASELAAQKLNRTEEIIALLERQPEPDPTISHRVVYLGGGEFRLVEADPPATDVTEE